MAPTATARNTRQRKAIRSAFQAADRPLSPEEVLLAAQQSVERIGIATVYRNLKSLVEEGWLVAVELPGEPTRYEMAGKGHHHHFRCNSCNRVFELYGCVTSFRNLIPPGFHVSGHEILLSGNCPDCRSALPSQGHADSPDPAFPRRR